jgi:copper oxidase (laccase) domain-containing protein
MITTKNNTEVAIGDVMSVGIYPYPGIERDGLLVLDLAKDSHLVVIATGEESLKDTDAAVCINSNFSLGIRTRDCAPICFADGKKIAIAHIGWQGFSKGLVEKTLAYFDPATVSIYVGPFLNSFEIQKDFCYDALVAKSGTKEHIREEDGILTFEFRKALQAILPEQTIFDTRDTKTDLSLPSHRRDKNSKGKGFLTAVSFAK